MTHGLCTAMLSCLDANGRGDLCYYLIRSMHEGGVVADAATYDVGMHAMLESLEPHAALHAMLEVRECACLASPPFLLPLLPSIRTDRPAGAIR